MTTITQLYQLVKQLNDLDGLPNEPYYTGNTPPHECYHLTNTPNNTTHYVGAGVYHLSQSYGGYMICRISSTPSCTGICTPIMAYHETKRICYEKANSYFYTLQTEKLKATNKLNLYTVIDALISVNDLIGVGLISLGDDIISHIKTHQK
jgi:hypothetical protein